MGKLSISPCGQGCCLLACDWCLRNSFRFAQIVCRRAHAYLRLFLDADLSKVVNVVYFHITLCVEKMNVSQYYTVHAVLVGLAGGKCLKQQERLGRLHPSHRATALCVCPPPRPAGRTPALATAWPHPMSTRMPSHSTVKATMLTWIACMGKWDRKGTV